MSTDTLALSSAPIIEAVVDIDCDMPPSLDLDALDAVAKHSLGDRYPVARRRLANEHLIAGVDTGAVSVTSRQALQALQYLAADERQIVQWRPNGFSFNRLAPYGRLDDYLPEIERNWKDFAAIAKPVLCRTVRLRYINRLALPTKGGQVELNDYLRVAPRSADDRRFTFAGFLSQQSMIDNVTGSHVNVVMATQPQTQGDTLPVIFDIEVLQMLLSEPGDWPALSVKIAELRALKNLVFEQSLTESCLNLYRP